MSKKSRKRNKKILAVLGLAGAAVAASRRNKGTAADANDGFRTKSNKSVSAGGGQTYAPTPKVVLPKVKPIVDTQKDSVPIGRMKGVGTDDEVIAAQKKRAAQSEMVRGVLPPSQLLTPKRTHNRGVAGNVNYRKDGGRATYKSGGAAKRGVSPILLKGKK